MATWKWTGDIQLGPDGLKILTGTGDPTGVVSAPKGSIYTRTDGGVGTSIYVKESGSGNTGWAAITTGGGGGGGGGVEIEVNGINTSLQTILNLTGSGVAVADQGGGTVQISTVADIVPYTNGTITTVKQALDQLLYVSPKITSISNDVGPTVEVGTTLTTVNVNWTLNETVTTLQFTAVETNLSPGSPPVNITPTSLTTKAFTGSYRPTTALTSTWTLSASDGVNTDTASTTIAFRFKRYWGTSSSTSLTSSAVIALSGSEFCTDKVKTILYDCTGGLYPYFCYPSSFGDPILVEVNGSSFSDYTISTVLVTNASGFTQNYKVIRFNNLQTGIMTVSWS